MAGGERVALYVLARNCDEISGLQAAFDWGDWEFLYGRWDCRSNQVTGTVPASPGGPRYGTIATAFDCIEGGRTAVIGIIHFVTGAGCVDLIESDDPLGTHVVSGDACTSTPVWGESWGRVCVGSGGLDGCEPPLPLLPAVPLAGCSPLADLATPVPCVTPVDPSTWGIIKHLHR